MKNVWKWFDGKKTAIGGVLSLVTAYLMMKGWIGDAEQILMLGLSTIFLGIGLGHKALK